MRRATRSSIRISLVFASILLVILAALAWLPARNDSIGASLVSTARSIREARAALADPVLPVAADDPPGYVTRHGDQLTLDGRAFRFVGVDAYELGTWWGQDAGCGASFDQAGLDAFFAALPPGSVVRAWAWQGSMGIDPVSHARMWAPLDRLVDTAAAYDDRLILSLASQGGDCDDDQWKGLTWYQDGYRQPAPNGLGTSYWTWVNQIVSRYGASPTIAMWEPVNEPEASTCPPGLTAWHCSGHLTCPDEAAAAAALRGFFDAVGGEIHALAPRALVESGLIGSGQCGAEGTDAALVEASPGIDVTSVHDYGAAGVVLPGSGANGERERLDQSVAMGKPLIVGETGTLASPTGVGCPTRSTRAAGFEEKIGGDLFAGASGVLVWDWVPVAQVGCSYDVGPGDPFLSWLRTLPAAPI